MGVYIRNITKEQFIEDCNAMGVLVITEGISEIDLVRCGECRYWNYVCEDEMFGMKYGECRFYKWLDGCNQGKEMLSTDFCSYGERRSDEGINE